MTTSKLASAFALPFPLLALLLAVSQIGCNGDPDSSTLVVELPEAAATALCEEFTAAACRDPRFADDPSCSTCSACTQPTSIATIRAKCPSPITKGSVSHCIDTGFDRPTCTGPEMGGCMFDVADELCPR